MLSKKLNIYTILASAFFISACSNTRRLPEGETLYVGSKVNIKDKEADRRQLKVLKEDLTGAVKPRPNSTILGIRLKLTVYNMVHDTSKKGFIRKAIRKFGEPPVLASQFDAEKNRKLLVNIAENKGFFYPSVIVSTKTRAKKTRSIFDVTTGPQYKIREVKFKQTNAQVTKDVAAQQPKTLLQKGQPYNLDLIKGERDRIDKQLKEIGYYYFNSDYLLVQVDTGVGDHQVDMYVKVKEDAPIEAREKYYINRVFIYPNYRIERQRRNSGDSTRLTRRVQQSRVQDTLFYERYYIIGNTKAYKPFVFTQAMQFYPGDEYNRTDQNMALNRLINIGTFKFVKNEFEPYGENLLDVKYQLTPLPKKSIRTELGGYTKNDSRVGSEVSVSWRNRNALRGAELFAIRASAGAEVQGGGSRKRPSIYQFSIEPSLTIPRFVIPFIDVKSSSMFVPKTVIRTRYDLQMRTNLYGINSFSGAYGYQWKENVKSEHQLFPINITYVKTDTLNKDSVFTINFSNLVFNGLIIGPTYDYTYNTRVTGSPSRNDYFFNGQIDFSGNILGLVQGASQTDKQKLFGQPYAQYMKFQIDFRHYLNYGANPNSILASRILTGFGYPYGNSNILPNVKQFFSGGNSSLRGFPSRLVGPGLFHEDPNNRTFIETSGDIKLELNTELRAQLYSFVHGALFIDAGNIWTYNNSSLFPGGKFSSQTFLNELAANVGAGIRFDFKILVLRLDLGIPVRKPWLLKDDESGEPWDFSFAFGDKVWRRENLILNLGIGYPF
jgi:outer membrane protein assembly factor BamA